MGLTSFGTSMYSIGQLKTLKDNIGEQGERIEFLSHQIQEQDPPDLQHHASNEKVCRRICGSDWEGG